MTCPICKQEYVAPNYPPGVMGSFIVGCGCPPVVAPPRTEKERRKRLAAAAKEQT